MDTDDLSSKTYKAILVEAEKFNHDLTLQFGLLSYDCENEKEYIREVKILIKEIRDADDYEIDDIFFGNPPDRNDLNKALDRIDKNIALLSKI
ncbi:MAG: hypothetical protein M3Q95_03145 [Bacteroidota bacterium]|nr:hypothetical protein [Bacteroidota bacterium]